MSLQNFVDQQGPVISAAWLNAIDVMKETTVPANTAAIARLHLLSKTCVFDGSDESALVQAAVNLCLATTPPLTLIADGPVRLGATVNIDRAVDSTSDEFIIRGLNGGGFYTTGNVVMFDTSLPDVESSPGVPDTTAPVSDHIAFEDVRFSTSSVFNTSYVTGGKFLRARFQGCFFWIVPFVNTTRYAQQIEFQNCSIRNNLRHFINCDGMYAVSFMGGKVENGFTLVRNLSTARGTNGLTIGGGITIQGMQATWLIANGVNGFSMSGYHLERNFSPEINFTGSGATANKSAHFGPGFIYNPEGESIYYDTTIDNVTSTGVRCTPNTLHSRAVAVTNLISLNDNCTTISDEPWDMEMGGLKIKSSALATRIVNKRLTLTYSASMAVNAKLANSFGVIVTDANNFAFLTPSNLSEGQRIRYTIFNTTAGAIGTATFTGCNLGASWTQPGANSNRSIEFEYNGAKLYEVSRSAADVAN